MRIVLATANSGKLVEYQRLLADVPGVVVESMADHGGPIDVIEDQDTFVGNALKKAREVAAHTGCAAMADDSGLAVDALDGRPGVYSARYAGEGASSADNNQKLLKELQGVPDGRRGARFVCVIVLVDAEGAELVVTRGTCEGRIAAAPRGEGGFGYDPLFIPDGNARTMAELTPSEKDAISHRGRATEHLVEALSAR
ncbi:MAG: RdgB/HAM1 family non-canonical purine NTP pyrophosphatase [Myxococcota bacterium]